MADRNEVDQGILKGITMPQYENQANPSNLKTYADQQRPTDVYDEHRRAVAEWQDACRGYREAEQRREHARGQMDKCTQIMAESLQAAMQDPTIPQEPGNGTLRQGIGGAIPRPY